ncbi:MAG TPA: thioredoxin family protein [Thermoanaerobaculia bacterium]|nr:thioredoxin family protein [Thermoanaerobaculia bacterium]
MITRRISLLAVLLCALATPAFAGGPWLKTVAAAQKVAKEKNQLILVDMFAQWCGWCHRFEREVFPSEVFQNATKDVVLLRLDTEDKGEGTQFAQKYGVSQLPTFLVLSADLNLAGMIRGYSPPNDFVASLKQTRTEWDAFQKRVKNEGSIAKDYKQRMELAKEFMTRNAWDKAETRFKKLMVEKGVPAAIRDDAYYHQAMVFVMQNKLDDGLKTVRDLQKLSKLGDPVERARLLAGQIYVQKGDLMGAANEFRSFKQQYPSSPHIRTVDMFLPDIERRLRSSGK